MISFIIGLFVGSFIGVATMALLSVSKNVQISAEEHSLGQENKIVVVEDIISDSKRG